MPRKRFATVRARVLADGITLDMKKAFSQAIVSASSKFLNVDQCLVEVTVTEPLLDTSDVFVPGPGPGQTIVDITEIIQ